MYKLTCISGVDLQKSFVLREGENLVGRDSSAHIRVNSPGVSKIHARIVQEGPHVFVEDLNSSNGTFVNGILVTKKELQVGDRISFYDTVYELSLIESETNTLNNIDLSEDFETNKSQSVTIFSRFVKFVDDTILPIFITMLSKYTFLTIVASLLILVSIFTTVIVVTPIMQENKNLLKKEVAKRSIFVANAIAKDNENKVGLDSNEQPSTRFAESVPGITMAFITDPNGTILAPEEYVGQALPSNATVGIHKILEHKYNSYDEIQEGGAVISEIAENKFVATVPIMSYSQEEGQSNYKGFAVVVFSSDSVNYSETASWKQALIGMAIAGFIWLLVAFIISRLYNFPFLKMYDELDLALKGDNRRIIFAPKSQAVQNLVELLNMMIRRLKRLSANITLSTEITKIGSQQRAGVDDQLVFETIGDFVDMPVFALDESNTITYNNSKLVNIASYNAKDYVGASVVDVIGDQDILGSVLSILPRIRETGSDLTDSVEKGAKLIRVTGKPIRDDNGNIAYIVIVVEEH